MGRPVTYKKLMNYHSFNTEQEMLDYIKSHRWRKYVVSHNAENTCWTVYHKER